MGVEKFPVNNACICFGGLSRLRRKAAKVYGMDPRLVATLIISACFGLTSSVMVWQLSLIFGLSSI